MSKWDGIIQKLKLLPHPEGGFYRETYRSDGGMDEKCLDNRYKGRRNYATCIYFLLTSDHFSAFHRIVQDEIWHFYDGSPVHLHMIDCDGTYSGTIIGRDIGKGEIPQIIVPGGTWFAAMVVRPDDFALVGCTVSPGFDFADIELASRESLLKQFPQHSNIITDLTR
jgi:uncharacterized protein